MNEAKKMKKTRKSQISTIIPFSISNIWFHPRKKKGIGKVWKKAKMPCVWPLFPIKMWCGEYKWANSNDACSMNVLCTYFSMKIKWYFSWLSNCLGNNHCLWIRKTKPSRLFLSLSSPNCPLRNESIFSEVKEEKEEEKKELNFWTISFWAVRFLSIPIRNTSWMLNF